MVFEYGHRTGRLHIHALMLNVAHLARLKWMDEWNQRAGYTRPTMCLSLAVKDDRNAPGSPDRASRSPRRPSFQCGWIDP